MESSMFMFGTDYEITSNYLGNGQLSRPFVSVCLLESLLLLADSRTADFSILFGVCSSRLSANSATFD